MHGKKAHVAGLASFPEVEFSLAPLKIHAVCDVPLYAYIHQLSVLTSRSDLVGTYFDASKWDWGSDSSAHKEGHNNSDSRELHNEWELRGWQWVGGLGGEWYKN